MAVTWITPAGNLGTLTERIIVDISLEASSDVGPITFSLIAGNLPRGLRLDSKVSIDSTQSNGSIKGSPVEVKKFTTSKFVIRASDGVDIEDRTFSLSVDGADIPQWITKEGFLKVGQGETYFVLDNSPVNFQLEARDTDFTAGDTLEYFLYPMGGQLPPGLTLSKDGLINGFTDPVFALEYEASLSGAYDTGPFDVTPIDFIEAKTNGFDSYFYDNVTFDYNEPSQIPRRLSRIYNFVVGVTDGANTVSRLFKIYVVTEEFLKADNSIIQIGTGIFTADNTNDRIPLWITESNLGRFRANNYLTLFLDVYDPPSLSGTISYFLLSKNIDGTDSVVPPGLEFDTITGELAGRVPYQAKVSKTYSFTVQAVSFPTDLANRRFNLRGPWSSSANYAVDDAVQYLNILYICIQANRNNIPNINTLTWTPIVSSAEKQFFVEIIGEIESAVRWKSNEDLGTIKPNQASQISVLAESDLYGNRISYSIVNGSIPPGLTFLSTGIVEGKVKQFGDENGPGLTRFYDPDSGLIDSTGTRSFEITFDGGSTTFDKRYKFTIRAQDSINFAKVDKEFFITVISDQTTTYANLYIKSFQKKEKRLQWFNFITDATIFRQEDIYRYGDPNFGTQTDLRMLLFAGIETQNAYEYVQAMSRNHYRKRMLFGDLKMAKAKDFETQETLYEVIYVELLDEYEKNSVSVGSVLELADNIESKVLISYDAIKVDSDIPFVSDSDHQRIFPNSIKNMRSRISGLGERDRTFLPLWMRSIQDQATYETGYVKALVLCYALPGRSSNIMARIRASQFDFKNMDFTVDRYIIDTLEGLFEDKYLAFPQRGEKLP